MIVLCRFNPTSRSPFTGGPFTAAIQTRFRKPADTAQTRLETRALDPKLDLLAFRRRRLSLALSLHGLVSDRKRGPFVSVQLLSRWAPHAGIDTLTACEFLRRYPHVFEVFTHPTRKNSCCRFTPNFLKLLDLEDEIVGGMDGANLIKLRKILSMSVNGRIHLHAIRLMRRELGLPENFRDSIIRKHTEIFRMVDWEIVELIDPGENENENENTSFSAKIEEWREKEYTEKWLSEFEVKYSFPVNFPTGFKIVKGFKEKLRNWQRLPYSKPYERVWSRKSAGVERYEKRAVGIIHELLCLTVEKTLEVERLAHFRKDLGIEVNLRELLLKHPGIFYVSTRGNNNAQVVFLREAYSRGCLVETSPVYEVRREMLGLILLGCRNTRELKEEGEEICRGGNGENRKDGDFVIPFLES